MNLRRLIALLSLAIVSLFFVVAGGVAQAKDGDVDLSFKTGSGLDGPTRASRVLPDGKILVVGSFTGYEGTQVGRVGWLNPDGTLYSTFQVGAGANAEIFTFDFQNDGKFIIGGVFTTYQGITRTGVARLNADGSLDPTFVPPINSSYSIYAVKVLPSGKVLIGGGITNSTGQPTSGLMLLLNADGSLDTSFNSGGAGANGAVYALYVQADGKILVGGGFSQYNNITTGRFTRLNANGTLDSSFTNSFSTFSGGSIRTITVQPDNKILVGGSQSLARLNADGTFDTSFTVGSWTASTTIYTVYLQPSGKIVVGALSQFGKNFVRLNTNGTLDSTFQSDGIIVGQAYGISADQSGNLIITGNLTGYNGIARSQIFRVNSDGVLDPTFGAGAVTGTREGDIDIAVQADGRILISNIVYYNAVPAKALSRLNDDGTLDSSFVVSFTTFPTSSISAALPQPDGKIYIAGNFCSQSKLSCSLLRLNNNGTVDSNFNSEQLSAATYQIRTVGVQSDSKVVIAGNFNQIGGVIQQKIARLTITSTLDFTFNSVTGADDSIATLAIQPDDKIIIGGSFTSYSGISRTRIARLLSDGRLDSTFDPGTGFNNTVSKVQLVADGKIMVMGTFTAFNGITTTKIVRLNSDGSLDSSFTPSFDIANLVYGFDVQADGKIIIGGAFTTYNGIKRNYVARLLPDGSLDPTFDPGVGPRFPVSKIVIQDSRRVLLTGGFAGIDYYGRNGFGRLEAVSEGAFNVALTSNANPATIGQSVTFTATATPITATGTVTFSFSTGANVTATLANGVATYVTNTLPLGRTFVTANYSGDANFTPLSSFIYTQRVVKLNSEIALTSTPNPAIFSNPVTFTANVTPITATGTVTFSFSTGGSVTTTLANGLATYVTNTLPLGSTVVTATYGGDANFVGGSVTLTQTITPACNPLVVTLVTDDGTGATCGTFSHALTQATSGQTVIFLLTQGSIITFTGSLSPTVPSGIILDGGANGVTLNGNGVVGDGLRLSGSDTLLNLTIRRFAGRELVTLGGGNKLYRVRLES